MKRSLLAALLLLATGVTAWSYFYDTYQGQPIRWPNARATVYHDANTITGAYVTELKAALAVWSNVSGSAFAFTHGGASPSANVKSTNNGNSDVYFDSSLPPFGYAVTMVNQPYTSANITERDIAFNGNVTWTTTATNQPGGPADFRTVAIHELGHVVGLRHPSEASPPQNVQSVMNTSADPAFAQHSLFADDMNAMRFLYPGSGPGPGPGPAVTDLVLSGVRYEPSDAGTGDRVDIHYTVTNQGAKPAGDFAVSAYLTGGLIPSRMDPFLANRAEAALDPGGTRSGVIDAVLPADLLPGRYRIGVLADAEGVVPESNERNNGAVSAESFRVDRPAMEVGPGQRISGELGPLGEDRFTMRLTAGTRLKLRGSLASGLVSLVLRKDGAAADLLAPSPGRKVKAKVRILEDGPHTLSLASSFAGETSYELSLRARKITTKGSGSIEGERTVTFLAYRGSKVTAIVKGKGGLDPVAVIEGLAAPVKPGRNRVRLGPVFAEQNETLALVIRGTGEARWTVKVKPPKKEIALSR